MARSRKDEAVRNTGEEEWALMKRSQPSVEIKRDGKGAFSFTVKVYDDDPAKAREAAVEQAELLDKQFKQ